MKNNHDELDRLYVRLHGLMSQRRSEQDDVLEAEILNCVSELRLAQQAEADRQQVVFESSLLVPLDAGAEMKKEIENLVEKGDEA